MSSRLKAFVVVVETMIFIAGFFVGVAARLGTETLLTHDYLFYKALTMGVVIQACLFYNGLYDFQSVVAPRVLFVRLMSALVLANLLLALLYYLLPGLIVGRGVAFLAIGFDVLVFTGWRLALARFMRTRPLRRVLLLGNGDLARELAAMVREREPLGYRFGGFLAAARPDEGPPPPDVVGTYEELKEVVRRTQSDVVVVAMPDRRGNMPVSDLLDLKFAGVEVIEGVNLYELFTEKIYVRDLKPSWMIFSEGFRRSDGRKVSKRILDVAASSLGILVAGIPMLITALLVRLTSPGPAIYAQERVGEFGKVFTVYKFRSMRLDAESSGPQLATMVDPRVTRFGNFIRKTRLDELPQLFNVLRGDMSLVGPRPERPFFVIKLQREIPFFRQRLFVKPGVTGLAQVKFRYAENPEDHLEKLQYDLAYIKNMSILYDIQIILETVKVMLFRKGAH